MKSDFILMMVESFYRWGHKSPKYFRVWTAINFIISGLAFLPLVLSKLKIITTGHWTDIVLACVAFSGAYGGSMNKLVVSNPDITPMPFTDKKNTA